MTPAEVMIATLAFGTCVFAVGMLAGLRLRKLRAIEGSAIHHALPEGEVTVIKGGVIEHIRIQSTEELTKLFGKAAEKK